MLIPDDIQKKIQTLYTAEADRDKAFQIYEKIKNSPTVVGTDQLFRSMLILAEADIEALKELGDNYWGAQHDDRDIVMYAEDKLGNPGLYGLIPFEF